MTAETLETLAHAAEWMAHESTAEDRGGRCSAYLHDAARDARRLAEQLRQVTTERPAT